MLHQLIVNLVFILLISSVCESAPLEAGVQFDKRADGLPLLKLPYGTWRASKYNPNGDIYVFKNIRFGAPPVGNLRWAKPAPPAVETEIQDGSYGPICVQAPIKGPQLTGPGADSPVGEAINQFLGGIPVPSFVGASEDCLFLDLYVPGKAIRDPSLRLPVISWFYGGAYVFGAKDALEPVLPLYDGTGLLQASQGNVIFVSSNYRLGAYGFLAGSTMEKDGLPNAGLHDQRAALQWIQDHISLVGGDKSQVSAWGESAGAGSILHHLVSYGGTQDPLFSKVILQSPAFQAAFDRKGLLEDTFQNFSALVGCAGQGLACLRAASAEALDKANTALNTAGPPGTFAVGPSTDGSFVRQLPALEFASGNFFKGISSLILSHVSDEAELFVPPSVQTDEMFSMLIDFQYPAYARAGGVTKAVEAHYPPVMASNANYSTEHDRLKAYVGEGSFYCNVRQLTDAYKGKTYNLRYAVTPGLHAVDLLPTFYNLNLNLNIFGTDVPVPLVPGFGGLAQAYQSYLVSHARTGNPNTYKKTFNLPPAITWPKPNIDGDAATGVLNVGDLGFRLIQDEQTRKGRCEFWRELAAAVTELGGYVAPGSDIGQNLVDVQGDVSRNYGT